MNVTNIGLKDAPACEITATIKAPGLISPRPFPIFYRFPREFARSVQISGDPFVASLLPTAMRLGEPLVIDAPVSSRLLNAVPRIMAFYHSWDPTFKMIQVKALRRSEFSDSVSQNEALFFSCGVDSFYALTKLADPGASNNLTHLILVHGFDIKLGDISLFERTRTAAEEVASYYEKRLVVVASNIREITDQYLSWCYPQGGILASVALCFGSFFRKIYLASDLGPNERSAPLTIHPDLDPLWSTGTTTLVHFGYGIGRAEKAKSLADNPMSQKHLRVCSQNRNGAYNCGRCSKCVRTMLALHLAGALPKFNFPTRLTPELVRGIDYIPDRSAIIHAEHIVSELQRNGELELAAELSYAIRITYLRSLLGALLSTEWGRHVLRRRLETLKSALLKNKLGRCILLRLV